LTIEIEGGTVIGFDGEKHRIIRDGVVVFDEDQIIHVGKSYQGKVDETVDAARASPPDSSTPTATHTHPSPPTTSQSTSHSTPTTSTQGSGCT
jgi:cytosine/adenosine deaminase-related metal-dependent hydrolase